MQEEMQQDEGDAIGYSEKGELVHLLVKCCIDRSAQA